MHTRRAVMSGRRQWRGRSDVRQDDQWATIEDDVLTVCQQGRTEQQCREEIDRQWPPAWTEFARMRVASGYWQECLWYEPSDEDRLVSLNVATLHRTRLRAWIGDRFRTGKHHGAEPGTQVNSDWAIPPGIGVMSTQWKPGSKQAHYVMH